MTPECNHKNTEVRRTWKRDGSVNLMKLPYAIECLYSNQGHHTRTRADYRAALLRGEVCETPLATFSLSDILISNRGD